MKPFNFFKLKIDTILEFPEKVVKNPVAIIFILLETKNNMNGNATSEGEDEDALK